MANQWEAEFSVSPELAKTLIEKDFPSLAPVTAELIGDGWDNTAHLINKKYIFRFPRREIAVEGIEIENNVLPAIAQRLTLPIPVPLYIGNPEGEYAWQYSGYAIIEGETACRMNLSDEERIRAAKPLALFLRALHGITEEEAAAYGAGPDKFGKLNLSRRVPQVLELLEDMEKKNVLDDIADMKKMAAEMEVGVGVGAGVEMGVEPPLSKKCMVHGDLYSRHLMINDNRELAGVIDWGDVHIGNPALDLGIIYSFLPPEGRKIFMENYGEIDEENLRLARFVALTIAMILMQYSHSIGDEDLLRESLKAVEFVGE